jgi:pimeloyl-ACP methyl ester carboxylesterase
MTGTAGRHLLLAFLVIFEAIGCRSRPASIHDTERVRQEDVRFTSGSSVSLAGTLFIPDDGRRHPAVVLFHGSGPQARLPWMGSWFAKHGVAALTYDKRGVGESTGDFRTVPFMDLCDDGLAGIAFLKRRSDIDSARLGVWGLSQGGWLGPLAASRSTDVTFVIAVSGPMVTPGEQMIFYYANELRHQGVSDAEIDDASALRRRVWHYLSTRDDYGETQAALARAAGKPWFSRLQQQADGVFARSTAEILQDESISLRQWFQVEMNYDPTVALRRLTVPALFLYGDKDEITPVAASVSAIRATLAGHADHRVTVEVLPGADHAMYVEEPDGRRVLSAAYLDRMASWLRGTL